MANQRLNATISIGGTVDRSLTRGLTNTKGQIGELQGVIGKATRRQATLSREIERMGRQGMNVEPLRRQYAQLGDEIDRARRRQAALQRLAGADVAGRFRTMTSEVGRLARRTAMVGTAVGAGIFGIANSTSELGDNVAKTADKIGMGVEELQAYRYAAERSGIASQTFDMATQRMVRRVAEAAQSSGAAKDAIEELGLSAQALASMTPDEQLNAFADALQGVENQGERVRIAMKLFDSEGVAMVNMLRDGSAGLNQLADDARRTGYILSEQAARDAETFQDKLLDTKLSLFGLKNIIGSDLMPVVSELMSEFTGWLSDNRQQVREWSALFAQRLKDAVPVIRDLASGIGTVATTVGNAVKATADLVGGFDNLGMIIGTVIAGKAIWSVVSFGGAIFQAGSALLSLSGALPLVAGGIKAIGAALMANPIGLIVGGIALAAGLIWQHWDTLGPWFKGLWDGITEKLGAAWEWMKETLSWSPIATVAAAWGGLQDWFAGLWDGITGAAEKAMDWITGKLEWVGNAFSTVKGWVSWGDDESPEQARAQLGGGNAGALNLGSMREARQEQEERGRQAAELAYPRNHPRYRGGDAPARQEGDKSTTINNQISLNVSRREGEADEAYAERIAEMVTEQLNDRQQGALYDG
ncbi:hypothetical protein [Halomonas sp. LES1]|uniref:hypothetical protein n=1 Tax=Halomonas sp. LES1 TaxID=3075513 RepID=UPI002886703C|nr:hypothetical protein [Halomonas sp. LES1]MDT0510461.1 hypothetical protein [Halomonas sp. LES1]